jgi:hypothetical protein
MTIGVCGGGGCGGDCGGKGGCTDPVCGSFTVDVDVRDYGRCNCDEHSRFNRNNYN